MRPILTILGQQPETPFGGWREIISNFLPFDNETIQEFLLGAVSAIAIFVVGRWAAQFARGIIERALQRASIDAMLVRFTTNIAYVVMITVVVISALDQLGVETTSVAAILAAAGFAVGMALQGSLGNFASGVMLIIFRPFNVGDFIEAGGTAGIVEELQVFSTVLRTPDNRRVVVPNSNITGGTITNNSINPTRRVDLTIGCGYDDDLRAVKSYLEQVLADDERVLSEPEPEVRVVNLGESSVDLTVRGWVNAGDFWATQCDLTERIKLGFDERGFSIPYPNRTVHVHQVAG